MDLKLDGGLRMFSYSIIRLPDILMVNVSSTAFGVILDHLQVTWESFWTIWDLYETNLDSSGTIWELFGSHLGPLAVTRLAGSLQSPRYYCVIVHFRSIDDHYSDDTDDWQKMIMTIN